jgi:hypothetical protein
LTPQVVTQAGAESKEKFHSITFGHLRAICNPQISTETELTVKFQLLTQQLKRFDIFKQKEHY